MLEKNDESLSQEEPALRRSKREFKRLEKFKNFYMDKDHYHIYERLFARLIDDCELCSCEEVSRVKKSEYAMREEILSLKLGIWSQRPKMLNLFLVSRFTKSSTRWMVWLIGTKHGSHLMASHKHMAWTMKKIHSSWYFICFYSNDLGCVV